MCPFLKKGSKWKPDAIVGKNLKNNIMDFKKGTEELYEYTCMSCGNTFRKPYQVYPYRCNVCGDYDCFYEEIISIDVIYQYCPICGNYFPVSKYLQEAITDEHVRWLANMVTHYRHYHLKSWDKMWGHHGSYYRHGWYDGNYDAAKRKVNERAKRQILRYCKDYMIENGFTPDHVKQLEYTDEKTIALYEKYLPHVPKNIEG